MYQCGGMMVHKDSNVTTSSCQCPFPDVAGAAAASIFLFNLPRIRLIRKNIVNATLQQPPTTPHTPKCWYCLWTKVLKNLRKLIPQCILTTTLHSILNAKLSLHGFWHNLENWLIKTIQTIPHNTTYVSFKLASIYCWLRLILVYPNP